MKKSVLIILVSVASFILILIAIGAYYLVTSQKPNNVPVLPCTENWTCDSWSDCSQGFQTRDCIDSKNCGSSKSKPLTSQSCTIVQTCSSQGGKVCTENQACTGQILNASDAQNCCTRCELKSCSAQGGNKCSYSSSCSSGFFFTGDTGKCCKTECIVCGATGYNKADGSPGEVCQGGKVCPTTSYAADDGVLCCPTDCVETNNTESITIHSCVSLGGVICGQNQACSRINVYSPGDAFVYNTQATDTQACCDITSSSVGGCVSGDISISGPAMVTQISGENWLYIKNFVTSYYKEGQPWKIANIPAELYIDGQLIKSEIVWANPQNPDININMNYATFDNGVYALRYLNIGSGNMAGKTVKVILDPDNEVVETNKGNNIFEGIIS